MLVLVGAVPLKGVCEKVFQLFGSRLGGQLNEGAQVAAFDGDMEEFLGRPVGIFAAPDAAEAGFVEIFFFFGELLDERADPGNRAVLEGRPETRAGFA